MNAASWVLEQTLTMTPQQGLALGLTGLLAGTLIQQWHLLRDDEPDAGETEVGFKVDDTVTYTGHDWDEPGWLVADVNPSGIVIVNGRDDLLTVEADQLVLETPPDTTCVECAGTGTRNSVIAGHRIPVICGWCAGTGDSENYQPVARADDDRAYDWQRECATDWDGAA